MWLGQHPLSFSILSISCMNPFQVMKHDLFQPVPIPEQNPHVHHSGFVAGVDYLCMAVCVWAPGSFLIGFCIVTAHWLRASGHMTAALHDAVEFLSSHLLSDWLRMNSHMASVSLSLSILLFCLYHHAHTHSHTHICKHSRDCWCHNLV